jgi:hypothetical protein
MRQVRRARRPSAGERGLLAYLGLEGVRYEGFAFASQGQGGAMHTIAAE